MRYVMLAVVLLAGVGLASVEVTLLPDYELVSDLYTNKEYPNFCYGDMTYIEATGDIGYAFIEFRELDDYVGRRYRVLSAESWLTLFKNWKDAAYTQPKPLDEDEIWIAPWTLKWEEMTITWNNQPGIYEAYAVERSVEEPEPAEEVYVSYAVQSIVQALLNGDLLHNGTRLSDSIIETISSDIYIYTWLLS